MATLLIKGISEAAKKHLKKQAEMNHRSMNQEVVHILKKKFPGPIDFSEFGPPLKPLKPITLEEVVRDIREARDSGYGRGEKHELALRSPSPPLSGYGRAKKATKKK